MAFADIQQLHTSLRYSLVEKGRVALGLSLVCKAYHSLPCWRVSVVLQEGRALLAQLTSLRQQFFSRVKGVNGCHASALAQHSIVT